MYDKALAMIYNVYVMIAAIYPVPAIMGFHYFYLHHSHLNADNIFLVDKNLFVLLH